MNETNRHTGGQTDRHCTTAWAAFMHSIEQQKSMSFCSYDECKDVQWECVERRSPSGHC